MSARGHLQVNVTADTTGYTAGLNKAKKEAAAFATHVDRTITTANNRSVAAGKMVAGGAKVATAAGAVSGVPGMGQAGTAIAGAAGAFFGLKEAANVLNIGMLKASGLLASFAFAINRLIKLYTEAYDLHKHLQTELETEVRAHNQNIKTQRAYEKALDANIQMFTKEQAAKLRKDLKSQDRETQNAAFAQIRRVAGGTKLNQELQDVAMRARIAAMPEGYQKSVAEEQLRYRDAVAKARQQIGDNPSVATQRIAAQIFQSLQQESFNRLTEIQRKQLEELKKIKENTVTYKNPFE